MTPREDDTSAAPLPVDAGEPKLQGPSLEEAENRISEISTIPTVALRIMEVAADPESGAADLKAVVEADPALCVRVIRCVNSASFGLRDEVSDLNQAISYLGFNQIRDLAISASVSDLFRESETVGTYTRKELWKHLVSVGICARMIAARTRIEGFENAFLAGLLHDIGIILFDQSCHDAFRQTVLCLTSKNSLAEVEKRLLGWDHTELGARVAAKWRLPVNVVSSIRYHHEPEACTGPEKQIVFAVSIANLMCALKHITSMGTDYVVLSQPALQGLNMDRTDLKVLGEDLDAELEANKHLFDLQG